MVSTHPTLLITGASSGLGLALAKVYLDMGGRVLALQRRSSPLAGRAGFEERLHDLDDFEGTPRRLAELVGDTRALDLVVLNAGILGEIRDLKDTPLPELERVMRINTWANKVVLDALFTLSVQVDQVVGISSGAAVSGKRGWSGYALSKATLVMLLELYAAERPGTHFSSVAPGLVDTPMQDALCSLPASAISNFPSVAHIQSKRGTADMPHADALAARLLAFFARVRTEPSGSYVDIRRPPR